jgi:hypothetical protein
VSAYSVVELRELIAGLDALLVAARVGYAVIGGVAVSLHGLRARTRDVEVLVLGTPATLEALAQLARERGWRPERLGAWHLRLWCDRVFADVVLAEVDLQRETIAHARPAHIAGFEVPVAAPEHLCALKLLARRPRDLRDVAEVREQVRALDVDAVNALLAPWGIEWRPKPGEIVPNVVELEE